MDKLYEFEKRPENVRQIGEQVEKGRIYFEDYVVTYMNQVFSRRPEKSIVIYLGKEGKKECADSKFIYGAVELEFDLTNPEETFSSEKWDVLYDHQKKYFPGSRILGWGTAVCMATDHIKKKIRDIQKKHFSEQDQICYLSDFSEETQVLYHFNGLRFEKISGYMVYYGKNPQMQNYMLRGKTKESIEASYTDTIMSNLRDAVKRNEEKKAGKKTVFVAAGILLAVLAVTGTGVLLQSNRKMKELEETLANVSDEGRKRQEEGEKKETMIPTGSVTVGMEQTAQPAGTAAQAGVEKNSRQTIDPEHTIQPETQTEVPVQKEKTGTQADVAAPSGTESPQKQEEKTQNQTEQAQKITEKTQKQTEKTQKQTEKPQSQKKKKVKQNKATKKTSRITQNSYIVQPGDTLSQIVWRQYHDLSKLPLVKKKNRIEDENKIKEGQRIILPVY